jgi:PAS domain-containing protein
VQEGVAETMEMVRRFNEISEEMANPDADYDKLLAEMGELQEQLDHRNAWELDSQLEQAMDADWGRLRDLQYSGLAKLTRPRLVAHGLAAMLVVQALWGPIHLVLLLGWAAALAVVLAWGANFDRTLEDADRRRITRHEIRRHTVCTVAASAIWVIPILVMSPFASPEQRLLVWSVMAMLMAGTALAFAAVPLGAVLFNAILGAASVITFLCFGNITAAAAAATFVIFLWVGSLEAARMFLAGKVAEAGVAEKSEVVSLLLREFEEGEADWLWQTDSTRRVRAASPRFAFALGEDPEDIDGKPLIQLIAGQAWENGHFHSSLHDLAERLKRRESFSNLLVHVTLHGSNRW